MFSGLLVDRKAVRASVHSPPGALAAELGLKTAQPPLDSAGTLSAERATRRGDLV
jgi:hypothetical protein